MRFFSYDNYAIPLYDTLCSSKFIYLLVRFYEPNPHNVTPVTPSLSS